jgi:hypothetical protein
MGNQLSSSFLGVGHHFARSDNCHQSAIGQATSPASRAKLPRQALAHIIGDKAEQAYRRGDAQEKRRKLMDAWAAYCERATGNVVQIRKR